MYMYILINLSIYFMMCVYMAILYQTLSHDMILMCGSCLENGNLLPSWPFSSWEMMVLSKGFWGS